MRGGQQRGGTSPHTPYSRMPHPPSLSPSLTLTLVERGHTLVDLAHQRGRQVLDVVATLLALLPGAQVEDGQAGELDRKCDG